MDSVIGKFLNTERSTLTLLGPLIVFRPTFPNCPGSGLVNLDYGTSKTLVQFADVENVIITKL